ncbi:MAG: hypothetical protein M3Y35_13835, partial [Actinomycetota bacterium]|nr:hypothetical protein [Actinomycetota bacterium]
RLAGADCHFSEVDRAARGRIGCLERHPDPTYGGLYMQDELPALPARAQQVLGGPFADPLRGH